MTTTKGHNGIYYQAGLRVSRKGQSRLRDLSGTAYRAIVINTYATDNERNKRKFQVTCDVILVKSQIPLAGVPVASPLGVNSGSPWIPKPTTATFSGAPLRLRVFDKRARFEGDATPFSDMNGDMVLVQFIEGDLEYPLITDPLVHESTFRRVVTGDGWSPSTIDVQRGTPELEEAYFRHGGTEARINKTGDLLIDTVGATDDLEFEIPTANTGDVQLRMKGGRSFTIVDGGVSGKTLATFSTDILGNLTIELADGQMKINVPIAGPATIDMLLATQPIVLGTLLQTALGSLVTALNTYAGSLGAGVPANPVTHAEAAAAAGVLATALTAFNTAVTASLSQTIKGS